MNTLRLISLSTLAALMLAGCATSPPAQQGASMENMPMMAMSDQQMMNMCMQHMAKMSPEMRQKHMQMMHDMMMQQMPASK